MRSRSPIPTEEPNLAFAAGHRQHEDSATRGGGGLGDEHVEVKDDCKIQGATARRKGGFPTAYADERLCLPKRQQEAFFWNCYRIQNAMVLTCDSYVRGILFLHETRRFFNTLKRRSLVGQLEARLFCKMAVVGFLVAEGRASSPGAQVLARSIPSVLYRCFYKSSPVDQNSIPFGR